MIIKELKVYHEKYGLGLLSSGILPLEGKYILPVQYVHEHEDLRPLNMLNGNQPKVMQYIELEYGKPIQELSFIGVDDNYI